MFRRQVQIRFPDGALLVVCEIFYFVEQQKSQRHVVTGLRFGIAFPDGREAWLTDRRALPAG